MQDFAKRKLLFIKLHHPLVEVTIRTLSTPTNLDKLNKRVPS